MRRAHVPDYEDDLHLAVAKLFGWALPRDAVVHHSPNEAIRNWNAAKLVKRGVRAGWPDWEILWQKRVCLIELKRKGGIASDDQIETAKDLRATGFEVHFCRSLEEVMAALKAAEIPCNARMAA